MSSSNSNNRRPQTAPSSGIPYGYVPAYLPGSASLVEQLDQTLLIVLRDGRHLVGTLVSFDQFSNLILQNASERKMATMANGVSVHADIPLGLYVVRGDSMVLLGELSAEETASKKVSLEELEQRLEEQAGDEELEWDFDTDLVA